MKVDLNERDICSKLITRFVFASNGDGFVGHDKTRPVRHCEGHSFRRGPEAIPRPEDRPTMLLPQ